MTLDFLAGLPLTRASLASLLGSDEISLALGMQVITEALIDCIYFLAVFSSNFLNEEEKIRQEI